MNDIAKKATAEKIIKLIDESSMSARQLEEKFGILAHSWYKIKRENSWDKIGSTTWDRWREIINTGDSLENCKLSWPPPEKRTKQPDKKSKQEKSKPASMGSPQIHIPVEIQDSAEEDIKEITIRLNIEISVNGKKIAI